MATAMRDKKPVEATPVETRMDLVEIPRASIPLVNKASWLVLMAAAERGEHGMRVISIPDGGLRSVAGTGQIYWQDRIAGKLENVLAAVDVSLFREGVGLDGAKDCAFLYGQSWSAKEAAHA